MKSKTKRKFEKFHGIYFAVVAIVITVVGIVLGVAFTIGDVYKSLFVTPQAWAYLIASTALISWGIIYICEKLLTHRVACFEQVDFKRPDENVLTKAIEGILNLEKAEPFYVHIAPKFDGISTIVSELKETGFVVISGEPGAGKSMAAYQAAYILQKEKRYRVYQLKTTELENKTGSEIISQVVSVSELDKLKGKQRLILIDDAHKLPGKEDLKPKLKKEAKENNGKYIWIETEEEAEEEYEGTRLDRYVRINFQNSLGSLLKGFYQSEEPNLQRALAGRIKGLRDAIKRVDAGKITDIWHFTFCATQGWGRLVDKVESLKEVELLVLFFISAHAVLSGESELHINDVIGKIRGLEFEWLSEQRSPTPIRDAIRKLASSELKLVRIYDKEHDTGYIRALHYNFARQAIGACLLKESLAKYMLSSAKALLTDDYRKCVYYGIFHQDIGQYASRFDRDNRDWLVGFLSNPLLEWLQCYPRALTFIRKAAQDVYDQIISELDIAKLAPIVSQTKSGKFQELAYLLNVLGNRRDELLRKLNFATLADTAKAIEAEQFQQLAYLLKVLGDHKGAMIEKLDFATLAETTVTAKVEQFPQLAYLLSILGDRKYELLKKCEFATLAEAVATAKIEQFHQVGILAAALGDNAEELIKELVKKRNLSRLAIEASAIGMGQFGRLADLLYVLGKRRGELIERLDLTHLAKVTIGVEIGQFNQLAHLLNAIGDRRAELLDKLDLAELAKTASVAEVGQFDQLADLLSAIGDRRAELLDKLDLVGLAKTASVAEVGQFDQLAHLLSAIGDHRAELLDKLDLAELAKTASVAEVGQFDQLAHLLSAIGDRRAELLDKLDLAELAKTASVAEVEQFNQLAHLLSAIGDRRAELLDKLDLAKLAGRTGATKVEQFQQVAFLLNALGERSDLFVDQLVAEDQKILKVLAREVSCAPSNRFHDIAELLVSLGTRKTHLIALLNHNALIETANQVGEYDIHGLTRFIAVLDEERRNEFIWKVDWASISMKCPIYGVLLQALGTSLANLIKQAEASSDSTGVRKVAEYLRAKASDIKKQIRKAVPNQYRGVAKFLWNYNQIDNVLATEIATDTVGSLIKHFSVGPANYNGAGRLINALNTIDTDLAASFVSSNKVREKIQQSINMDDWSENVEDLKHLVKAFYRSAPDLWEEMVNSNWIVVNLSFLDLDSIYKEVDEEKNTATGYNTA